MLPEEHRALPRQRIRTESKKELKVFSGASLMFGFHSGPPPNNRPLTRPPHLEDAESRWGLLAGAGPFPPTFRHQEAGQMDLEMARRRCRFASDSAVSRCIQRGFSLQHASAGYPFGNVQHMMRSPQAPSLQQPGAAHYGYSVHQRAAELQRSQSEMHPAPNPQRIHLQQFLHSLHALVESGLSYAGWQADVNCLRNDAATLVAADWTSECFQRWLHMNRRIAHMRAKQHFCASEQATTAVSKDLEKDNASAQRQEQAASEQQHAQQARCQRCQRKVCLLPCVASRRTLPCQWQREAEPEDAPEENQKRERGGAEAEAEAVAAVADGGEEEAVAGEGAEAAVEVKCSDTKAGRLHEQLLVAEGAIVRREEWHGASARRTSNGAGDDMGMVNADERADFEQSRGTSAAGLRQHKANAPAGPSRATCAPPQEVNGMSLLFREGQGAGLDQDDGRAGYAQEEQEKEKRWTTRHRRENVGGRLDCTPSRGGTDVQGAETSREQCEKVRDDLFDATNHSLWATEHLKRKAHDELREPGHPSKGGQEAAAPQDYAQCPRAEQEERGREGERERGGNRAGARGRDGMTGSGAQDTDLLQSLGTASAGKRQKCELRHTRNDDECALRDCEQCPLLAPYEYPWAMPAGHGITSTPVLGGFAVRGFSTSLIGTQQTDVDGHGLSFSGAVVRMRESQRRQEHKKDRLRKEESKAVEEATSAAKFVGSGGEHKSSVSRDYPCELTRIVASIDTGSQDIQDVDGEARMLRVGGDAEPASPLHARAREHSDCEKDNGKCERRDGERGKAVTGETAEEEEGEGHRASGREEGAGEMRASRKDRMDVDDELRGGAGQNSQGEAQTMAEFLDKHPAIDKVHYRDGSREGARQGDEGYCLGDMDHDDISTVHLFDGDAGAARVEAGGRGRVEGSDEAKGAFEEAVKGKGRGRRGQDTDAQRLVRKKNEMTTGFWQDTYSLLADFRRRHGHLCLPVPSSRDTGSNFKRFCACVCARACMRVFVCVRVRVCLSVWLVCVCGCARGCE